MSGCYNLLTNACNAQLVCAKTGSPQFPECLPKCSDGHVINIDSVTAGNNDNGDDVDQSRCYVPHHVRRCPASAIHLSCNGYRHCNKIIFHKHCLGNPPPAPVDIKYNCINGTKMFYYLSICRIVLKIIILSVSVGLVLTCDSFVTIVIFYRCLIHQLQNQLSLASLRGRLIEYQPC